MYGFLADVIVAVHVAYVGTVIVGLLLILLGIVLRWQWIRNPWFRFIHLAMMLIVAFEAYIQFECPLTTWERNLREAAGQTTNETSFVGRMLGNVLFYPQEYESTLVWCYYAFAALILATFILAPPRLRRRHRAAEPIASPRDLTAHGTA
jgi:hypothetical protein